MGTAFYRNHKVRWVLPAIFELPFRAFEQARTRLIDLRSPGRFADGFIPGSVSIPNLSCLAAARRCQLFHGRDVYLLADDLEQLQRCPESQRFSPRSRVAGWFGSDALDEWCKSGGTLGSLETITAETLAVRLAGWNTLVIDVREPQTGGEGLAVPDSLRIPVNQLRDIVRGLPASTSVCLICETGELASLPASILWNSGFHKIAYLEGGFLSYVRNGMPVRRQSY